MGIYEGLNNIQNYREELERKRTEAKENAIPYLKLGDGESVRVRFLQELDPNAEGYDKEIGLGILATEHVKPGNFRLNASCTADEGDCVGCEEHAKNRRAGWSQKSRLYINVLVERKDGTKEVAVLSQPNGSKSVVSPAVLEHAVEYGTITDRWWKLTREGEGMKTSYRFTPLKETDDVDVHDYVGKTFDVHKCVRQVPYEEQREYYFSSDETDEPEEKPSATDDESW